MKHIFIYWIDRYTGGYRSGVAHGSIDGEFTLCKKDMKINIWDGGYATTKTHSIECKNCLKVIDKLKTTKL